MGGFDSIVVAADARPVQELCASIGAPVVMTDPALPSGTDRVAQVVGRPEFGDFSVVVNIQGDEPLVEEEHLRRAIELVADEGWEVGTCAAPLRTHEALQDPGVVKVVRDRRGGALYFSRAPIPHRRDGRPSEQDLASGSFLRHVGVYTYTRTALKRWVLLPPSPLEELERLEQLRALEEGMRIGVAVVEEAAPGVDTAADIRTVEEILTRTGEALSMKDST
jgi:3-deoxy-manno-octulosonate cytidylyltransferase (CMP-KDO synthetase)